MKKFIVTAIAVIFSTSLTAGAATVSDNKAVAKIVESTLSTNEAAAILQEPFDGFVEIRGKAKRDSFQFSKVKRKASFPDNRWEETALSMADQLNIPLGQMDSSSRMKPSATAYVYFYKDGIEGVNTAGSRQVDASNADGEYMAVLVIRQKGAKGNVRLQNQAAFSGGASGGNKVYKFRVEG